MKPVNQPSAGPTAGPLTSQRPAPVRPANGAWRRVLFWVAFAALVVAIAAGLWPGPREVEIAPVTTGPLTVSVLEEGKTRIRHRYTITAPVAGMLQRISLRAADRLEGGKTVVAIIQPSWAAFLDPRTQAEAEARVNMAEATKRQRQAQLERAQAALEMANKERERIASLRKNGAVSIREWDQALNLVEVLTRELHAAEFGLEVAEFEIQQARAAARQSQADPNAGAEPITLLAPVTGFVLNVFEESARPVTPGLPLLEVGDPTDLEAEIELLSSDAVAVAPGASVSIEQWGGDRPLRGRVTVVEPGGYTKFSALGVEEQRVRVRVDFVEPIPADRPLGDRFRVEARIVTWHSDSVLQVPSHALFRRGADWMTFVVDHGKARLTKVGVGHNNEEAAEIVSGLSAGQSVILHPPDGVADGSAVRSRNK